ncbi:MAG TPA: hypothetical protein G4N92_08060 [Anaerolineae bacterium]|nr:hypothetical protein [Anaerolineae bacterium]
MQQKDFAYLPPIVGNYKPPLDRFLPPVPRGVISTWLKNNLPPGSVVIDPLGANPMLALEAARAGYRVLMAANNPILKLMSSELARSSQEADYQTALVKLLASPHAEESLESHLQSLYLTPCNSCSRLVQARGFIWEKGKKLPIARVYACPFCGDEDMQPITTHDLKTLESIGNIAMHRSRALQRVLLGGEYEQRSLEDALDCYSPRSIYITVTLMNKLDSLDLTHEQHQQLQALLLVVFDQANVLWHWPEQDFRPRQLFIPAYFIEKNLYLALEEAYSFWVHDEPAVEITHCPDLPPAEGGICLYQRQSRQKLQLAGQDKPQAVLTVFPRPNQAFWTFSALWTGWLMGRKGIQPIRSALERRRYDWYWLARALHAAIQPLAAELVQDLPFFGLFSEPTPANLLAVLAACHASGFALEGFAFREEDKLIQCHWCLGEQQKETASVEMDTICRQSISDILLVRGEPADYHKLAYTCSAHLARSGGLPTDMHELEPDFYQQLSGVASAILRDPTFLITYKGETTGGNRWWLAHDKDAAQSLSDLVEVEILGVLREKKEIAFADLDKLMCQRFPGKLVPSREFMQHCLDSYADMRSDAVDVYCIREQEDLSARQTDLQEAQKLLAELAKRLGYSIGSGHILHWRDSKGLLAYTFFLTATSIIGSTVLGKIPCPPDKCVLVFPGSRSRLLHYKIRHNPRLKTELDSGWHFLKLRYLRKLAERHNLTLELWQELLDGDPPLWEPPKQLKIL